MVEKIIEGFIDWLIEQLIDTQFQYFVLILLLQAWKIGSKKEPQKKNKMHAEQATYGDWPCSL